MKEFHRDFANRTGLAQAWTVKSADRLFTLIWPALDTVTWIRSKRGPLQKLIKKDSNEGLEMTLLNQRLTSRGARY